MTIFPNNLGMLIKSFREKQNLSQQDLSERCGVNKTHIQDLENNEYGNIPLNTLKRIAQTIGLTQIKLSLTEQPSEEEQEKSQLIEEIISDLYHEDTRIIKSQLNLIKEIQKNKKNTKPS